MMRVLLLAPQPFFQERGTPIAVKLASEVLGSRDDVELEVLCYPEGERTAVPQVLIRRFRTPAFLRGVGPGVSWKKVILDIFMLCSLVRLLWKRRRNQYDLIHAVEESVFMALLVRLLTGIPYIYDMDSCISAQLVARWPRLRFLSPLFAKMESLAVRKSMAVIAVCPSLVDAARAMGAPEVFLLSDVSLLDLSKQDTSKSFRLRKGWGAEPDDVLILYVGNLEPYQGMDLLIEAFGRCIKRQPRVRLAVVGGRDGHIEHYRKKCEEEGFADKVHFAGARPLSELGTVLSQADILVSPRITGTNTPMKIYSYLHSGKPIVATSLLTHSQVLDSSTAMLADPSPEAFGKALSELAADVRLREALGEKGRRYAEERFTFSAFSNDLNQIYSRIRTLLRQQGVCRSSRSGGAGRNGHACDN